MTEREMMSREIGKLREENKRYRDGIKQAISHFNYDEHQAGMFCLRKALEGDHNN